MYNIHKSQNESGVFINSMQYCACVDKMDILNWRYDFEKVANHADKLLSTIEIAKMIKWDPKLVIGMITNVIFLAGATKIFNFKDHKFNYVYDKK